MASIGNRLDYWLRMGQSQQTIGIPVGPDTSWVLSELVLVAIEEEFERRFGQRPRGCILIDDFELAFGTLPEAEQALAILEASLNHFELSLNAKKTEILQLPQPLGSAWTEELATFRIRSRPRQQATDLIRYFNHTFKLARDNPDQHVMNYALARMKTVPVSAENWEMYQALLLQCMVVEPGCLQYAEVELRRNRAAGHQVDLDALTEALTTVIVTAAPPGHTAEVCWALWIAILFDVDLGQDVAAALEGMNGSFVALLSLHADQLGRFPLGLDPSSWEVYQTEAALCVQERLSPDTRPRRGDR